jgi:(p)ppGpp synthase/HD superfamily hydrolase
MDKTKETLQTLSGNDKLDEFDFDDFYGSMKSEYTKALDIASWAHRDQKDKAGKPYFGHLARVSMACESDVAKIVALLHDVIEDTDLTPDKLEEMGVSEFIVKSVVCLTRKSDESYDDFIKRLAPNPIAREVKIADLEDNMDVRRMKELGETDTQRLNKYIKAWNYLKNYKAE